MTGASGDEVALVVGGVALPVALLGNPTAAALRAGAPLDLSLEPYGGQEWLAPLPAPLDITGAPRASGAAPGDIAYYAPQQVLVVYHADVAPYPGIVPVGRIDPRRLDVLHEQVTPFPAVLERVPG